MTNTTVEIVTFKAVAGTTPTQMAEAAAGLTNWLAGQDGFISRTLSQSDGTWTDHVIWRDLGAAQNAAAKLMAEPCAGPFMSLIAPESVAMSHGDVMFSQGS